MFRFYGVFQTRLFLTFIAALHAVRSFAFPPISTLGRVITRGNKSCDRVLFLHASGFPMGEEDSGSSTDDKIDAFLKKKGNLFAIPDDAPAPGSNILLSPSETIQIACEALRRDKVSGPRIFLGFCLPLTSNEKMSGTSDAFKELIRASITPKIFSTRIRASPFSVLLDWNTMSVTEGYSQLGYVAFVNAALFFEGGAEPVIVQFRLRRSNGLWLIDRASRSKRELFFNGENDENVGLT